VDEAIILEVNQSADVDEIQLEMKRAPFPPYTSDDVIYFLQSYLSFTFILSFIVTAPTIVKEITLEKEKKLKVNKML
jgi:ATP-binding cassette subfamily A (ABC1) protein 3